MANDEGWLAVVVRYTHYEGVPPQQRINLMSWHEDVEDAEAEAARLNRVRRGQFEYFVRFLRKQSKRPRPTETPR